ncbi:dehydrogenase/reductase SDR family member 7-like [Dysidea avara]|uniref:dehydrogenase/reductase SDR family member 7-like n=1 Tax=Dysidea avara TaxID=196820 RepID=UPI003324A65B
MDLSCAFMSVFEFLFHHLLVSVGVLLALLILVLIVDCDLVLAFYCRFGKKPSKALSGKVVWITGASSGIGEELAYQLAKCGAKLVLSARRKDELERVAEKCKQLSPEDCKDSHLVLPLDLSQFNTHTQLVDQVVSQYGKIDILVNNGGRSQRALAVETSLDVHQVLLEINTLGTISLSQAVVKQMGEQDNGLIVVVSSIAGKLGAPASAGYSATKHALQGYFGALRMEVVEKNIDIQLVCPGPVVSKISLNAFSSQLEKPVEALEENQAGRMSTERCVHLMLIGMANRLKELWISPHPVLLFTYIMQYFPNIALMMGQVIGPKRVKAFKAGNVHSLDAGYLK